MSTPSNSTKHSDDTNFFPALSDSDDDMPPPSLRLTRTLSHQDKAAAAAQLYFDRCEEGDTVLSNFFTDYTGWTVLEYYKKENGNMVLHRIEAPYKEINIVFTYESTDFGF
jgi:hypothetical protein